MGKSQFVKIYSNDHLTTSQKIGEVLDIILECLNVSLPTSFFFLCMYAQQSINLSFISKTYNNYKMVDAIGLSHLYINCTTFIVTVGLISGLNSLGSNAYSRGNNYIFGLYINRCRIVAYGFLILMTIFNYFFAVRILSLFSIDPEILDHCSKYVYLNMIMLYIEVTFNINLRILSITGKSNTNMITLAITLLLHPLWCYIFINVFDLGVSGAAFAMMLTQLLNSLASSFYILYFNPAPGSNFFNLESFTGIVDYLRVALPCTLITISEWMGFEIQAFIAIKIGEVDYSVYLIIFNLSMLIVTFNLGLRIAISTKISNLLVRISDNVGDVIDACIRYINIIIYFGLISSTAIMLIVYIFRGVIIDLYTNDPGIYNKAVGLIPILVLQIIGDNLRCVFVSLYKGLTYLTVPSILQFIFIYIIQTLLSVFLALYLDFGIKGIWIALTVSVWLLIVCYAYIYYHFDFLKYRNLSIARLKEKKVVIEEIFHHDEVRSEIDEHDCENTKPLLG
jgi:MATE family multidrug resistance protein